MGTVLAEGASTWVSPALENISTVFNQALTMIQGNEIALFFIGVPMIGAAFGLFHRLIRH